MPVTPALDVEAGGYPQPHALTTVQPTWDTWESTFPPPPRKFLFVWRKGFSASGELAWGVGVKQDLSV